MPIIDVFSAVLYLAHPELDRVRGVGLLTEIGTESRLNFLSVDRFVCYEFDDYFLLAFYDILIQASFDVM
jgi:hypothetical protein